MWWVYVLILIGGVALGLLAAWIMRTRAGQSTDRTAGTAGTDTIGSVQPERQAVEAEATQAGAEGATPPSTHGTNGTATTPAERREPARSSAAAGPGSGAPRIEVPEFHPLPTQAPLAPLVAAPSRQHRPGELTADMVQLLSELPGIIVVVDEAGAAVLASEEAIRLRLARRGRLSFDDIAECATRTLALDTSTVAEVSLRRPPMRRLDLRVHGIPLPDRHALLLMTDLTEEHRLAAVRRDFIANISHELKTPVGAMALLAEALAAARDDPDAVEHFASRMQTEARRLTTLINDVIDLSRVQGDNPLEHAEAVSVDDLVAAAVDFVHGAAEMKDIAIVVGGDRGEKIFGDPGQLETAVRNVLGNAVAYSEPGTQVAVVVRTTQRLVEIDVKDQGMGIPESELDRIFERFYRVDAARSRVTGGTGLGLSIVRNVCRNHGGDCLVWSVEHEGSTFTLQLPRYVNHATDTEEGQL